MSYLFPWDYGTETKPLDVSQATDLKRQQKTTSGMLRCRKGLIGTTKLLIINKKKMLRFADLL